MPNMVSHAPTQSPWEIAPGYIRPRERISRFHIDYSSAMYCQNSSHSFVGKSNKCKLTILYALEHH